MDARYVYSVATGAMSASFLIAIAYGVLDSVVPRLGLSPTESAVITAILSTIALVLSAASIWRCVSEWFEVERVEIVSSSVEMSEEERQRVEENVREAVRSALCVILGWSLAISAASAAAVILGAINAVSPSKDLAIAISAAAPATVTMIQLASTRSSTAPSQEPASS
ncbi:MAG: hypothetical protein GXO32_03270 [Crenarchaeota archaeon]|nr:hypothetical protein [Thermoproteota archaeon]